MTQSELKGQLIASPDAVVGYIVQNNPEAVSERLRGLGFVINGPKSIEDALNALLDKGQNAQFIEALNVPFLTEDVDPNEVVAVRDAVVAMNAARGTRQSVDLNALFGGLATGTLFYLQSTGQQNVGVKPPGTSGTDNKPPQPNKDNTMLYIGVGVGLLLLVLLIIFLVKRKG